MGTVPGQPPMRLALAQSPSPARAVCREGVVGHQRVCVCVRVHPHCLSLGHSHSSQQERAGCDPELQPAGLCPCGLGTRPLQGSGEPDHGPHSRTLPHRGPAARSLLG